MITRFVLLASLFILISPHVSAQHRQWQSLKSSPRALWVWNPAKTAAGLPPDAKAIPTKAQLAVNKRANKTWTGVRTKQKFAENYKGIQSLLFDFCQNKSINEIYMFGSTWEWDKKTLLQGKLDNEQFWVGFNAEARKRGIKIWLMFYLWDAPDDQRLNSQSDAMAAHARAVAAFNKAHPGSAFVGIHCDQEPRSKKVYPGLLKNMQKAQKWVDTHAPALLVSQALRPAWIREKISWNGSEKTMNEHILDEISHAALMCYYDNTKVIDKWSTPLVQQAAERRKKVAIGFEANNLYKAWKGAERETWWEEIHAETPRKRFAVNPDDNRTTFEEAMQQTDSKFKAHPGYDRMVIHSYSGYFRHWFGQFPRDYVEGLKSDYKSKQDY